MQKKYKKTSKNPELKIYLLKKIFLIKVMTMNFLQIDIKEEKQKFEIHE
jgi:hypothetical protein